MVTIGNIYYYTSYICEGNMLFKKIIPSKFHQKCVLNNSTLQLRDWVGMLIVHCKLLIGHKAVFRCVLNNCRLQVGHRSLIFRFLIISEVNRQVVLVQLYIFSHKQAEYYPVNLLKNIDTGVYVLKSLMEEISQ